MASGVLRPVAAAVRQQGICVNLCRDDTFTRQSKRALRKGLLVKICRVDAVTFWLSATEAGRAKLQEASGG